MSGADSGADARRAALQRACELSRELAAIAVDGSVERTVALDAERRRLLESVRIAGGPADEEGRRLLKDIVDMNDRSIGALEHRLRATVRDMDMAFNGSRALRAYAATGPRRF